MYMRYQLVAGWRQRRPDLSQAVFSAGGPAVQFSALASDGKQIITQLDQGVTHATQGAKRGREQSEPVPDALYRHWFVLGGTLVSSRFAPSDADVLGAGVYT